MNLSLFHGFRDTVPQEITLEKLLQLIQTDRSVHELTEKYRYSLQSGDEAQSQRYKQMMPCFAVAVLFKEGKKQQHIQHWTGLSLVDIDKLPSADVAPLLLRAVADEHTLFAYPTISGNGLRILFRYQFESEQGETLHPDDHLRSLPQREAMRCYREAFLQGNEYYRQLLELTEIDGQCKNATRLSTLAHCPDVHYRSDATPIVVHLSAPSGKRGRPRNTPSATQAAPAVARQLKQRGLTYAPGHHNEYISQALYLMNSYGVPLADATQWALEQFADYAADNDIPSIARSCYQHTHDHATLRIPEEKGRHCASIGEIQQFLQQHEVRIRHNQVSRKHELYDPATERWTELRQSMVHSLYCRFCLETDSRMHLNDLFVIIDSDFYPSFNPFISYLQSLPPWDGFDYIDQLASTVHVSGSAQALHNRFFKKWFVAMLPTWIDPEVTNHEILTYIGEQGIYKSTFMRQLLPPELHTYFSAKNFSHRMNRDDKLELTEMGLIALEELDHMSSTEVNQLKAIIGHPMVNERAVYDRYKEQRNLIASFCGTGNNPRFLSDLTGNRRWLPFLVDSIDSPLEHPFNYTGLYSQAYALWKQGFCYWFTPSDNAELKIHNKQFEEPCLESELIQTYFRPPGPSETGEFFTATRIMESIQCNIKLSLNVRNISINMNKLGYHPRRSGNLRGWNVVPLSGTQIKEAQRLNALRSDPE